MRGIQHRNILGFAVPSMPCVGCRCTEVDIDDRRVFVFLSSFRSPNHTTFFISSFFFVLHKKNFAKPFKMVSTRGSGGDDSQVKSKEGTAKVPGKDVIPSTPLVDGPSTVIPVVGNCGEGFY